MKRKSSSPAKPPAPAAIPIREIRGQRVLLDSDLATIYGVTTSALNQAVKRNLRRFPAEFLFQLTSEETASLRSQIVTPDAKAGFKAELAPNSSQNVTGSTESEDMRSQFVTASKRNVRHLPYAFTEHGALQAANILKSERAAATSVFVIRAFVGMRATLLQSDTLAKRLSELEARLTGRLDTHEHAIVHVMQQLVKLLAPTPVPPRPPKPKIGFKP